MTSISSALPALRLLAPPAPGGTAATAGVLNEQPIRPVQPVTRRSGQRDEAADGNQASTGTGTASTAAAVGRDSGAAAGGASAAGGGAASGLTLKSPAQPSTGFIAQRLSQESLGGGLHIEPWAAALNSYRNAAALPASASRSPGVVV